MYYLCCENKGADQLRTSDYMRQFSSFLQVSLFAELFNELLMRDFGFQIFKALCAAPEKPKEDDKKKKEKEKKKDEKSEEKEEDKVGKTNFVNC